MSMSGVVGSSNRFTASIPKDSEEDTITLVESSPSLTDTLTFLPVAAVASWPHSHKILQRLVQEFLVLKMIAMDQGMFQKASPTHIFMTETPFV